MTKNMLIDASHEEEVRCVVIDKNNLEEFDFETSSKKQIKGNIYLAKVTRVEPSLQAAFVEYGAEKQGFLPMSEIHVDYFQIPTADRQKLLEEEQREEQNEHEEKNENSQEAENEEDNVEILSDVDDDSDKKKKPSYHRRYKIQEVIKKNQVLLVQVTKEERSNKGASMTTFISIAGRYCVLMPKSNKNGGISRKISDGKERKKLREIAKELRETGNLTVIIRTAGISRTKAEIKRDYEYLCKAWEEIRSNTMESNAPALIHEESNIINRSLRDIYTNDIDAVYIQGKDSYRQAKDYMKILQPSHAAKIKEYKNDVPLFTEYNVDEQLDELYDPIARAKSGAYIVINPTEALTAIDVNSGKANAEKNIEETALKTNIDCAQEIARQLRLRDLGGLIVIDFIDMYAFKNRRAVERVLKDSLKADRARIHVGKISPFGLLEISRQRLRPSFAETVGKTCPNCNGLGYVRSRNSIAMQIIRQLEKEASDNSGNMRLVLSHVIATHIMNKKRHLISGIEDKYGIAITIIIDLKIADEDYKIIRQNKKKLGNKNKKSSRAKPNNKKDKFKKNDESKADEDSTVRSDEESTPEDAGSVQETGNSEPSHVYNEDELNEEIKSKKKGWWQRIVD